MWLGMPQNKKREVTRKNGNIFPGANSGGCWSELVFTSRVGKEAPISRIAEPVPYLDLVCKPGLFMKEISAGQNYERFTQSPRSYLSMGIIEPTNHRVRREQPGDLSVVSVR
jgi:hypothetical protein